VTLAVGLGITSADISCCARLGVPARGDGHNEAIELLRRADPGRVTALSTVLEMKTRAGYRAIGALLAAARAV